MYAFVLVHFGNNPKYLELEIYTITMLKKNTKHDIIYLYYINDTPKEYIEIMDSLSVITEPYDDKNITYDIKGFVSSYEHFNTLRTCNFIFAYALTKYKKICIIESDMVIMKNLDNIFKLKTPAVLYYPSNKNINKNHLIDIDREDILKKCIDGTPINGGVILFEPSMGVFRQFVKNIKLIIKDNCKFPNETLFLYTEQKIYNLPVIYNMSHYYMEQYNLEGDVLIYHFNSTQFKPIDIIKDNYINKDKKPYRKRIVIFFKKNYYDIYHEYIDNIYKKFFTPFLI